MRGERRIDEHALGIERLDRVKNMGRNPPFVHELDAPVARRAVGDTNNKEGRQLGFNEAPLGYCAANRCEHLFGKFSRSMTVRHDESRSEARG